MRVALVAPIDVPALQPWLPPVDGDVPPGKGHRGGIPVTRIAAGLLRAGQQLTIVSVDAGLSEPRTFDGGALRLILVPTRSRHRTRDLFRVERRNLRDALEAETPDLIHAHWTYEYALAALATGRRTLITVRDWSPLILRMKPDAYRVAQFGMNAATLARARHLAAPSPYMQRTVERWVRRPVAVLPNGIDDDVFVDRVDHSTDGTALIAVNNGWGRRKNVSTLLEAFASVRERHPAAVLRLVGYQYGPDDVADRWARERGLDGGVEFLGELPNPTVRDLIRRSLALVHPSREESFGAVLIESMALGRAVVGGHDSGAVPWVLDGGRAGLLTDVRSARDLAGAMLDLIEHGSLRRRVAEAGHESAWTRFRTSVVAQQHLDHYARILERPPVRVGR